MATLTGQQVFGLSADGNDAVCTFLALRNVTSGDTFDANAMGFMQAVHRAVFLGVTAAVSGDMAVTGSVVTVPDGLSGDDGYALIWGSGG